MKSSGRRLVNLPSTEGERVLCFLPSASSCYTSFLRLYSKTAGVLHYCTGTLVVGSVWEGLFLQAWYTIIFTYLVCF